MQSSYRTSRRLSVLAVAALLFPILAVNGYAQRGNQSDVSGIPITTSSIVSPIFAVPIGRAIRVTTFVTPQVANSFQLRAARINAELGSQTFASVNGTPSTAESQNLVYEVASGENTSAQAAARLVAILTTGNASTTTIANAEAFVESFRGLLASGIAMDQRFFNTITATQLANAAAAYNAFIDSSNESFLADPPPELAIISGVLRQLTSH